MYICKFQESRKENIYSTQSAIPLKYIKTCTLLWYISRIYNEQTLHLSFLTSLVSADKFIVLFDSEILI